MHFTFLSPHSHFISPYFPFIRQSSATHLPLICHLFPLESDWNLIVTSLEPHQDDLIGISSGRPHWNLIEFT